MGLAEGKGHKARMKTDYLMTFCRSAKAAHSVYSCCPGYPQSSDGLIGRYGPFYTAVLLLPGVSQAALSG